MRVRSGLLVLCVALVATLTYAQDTDTSVLKLPQDIEFKGPLSGPPQTAVLYGDPTKPGVFVSRVKFPAGWKDPPHWHPDEVESRDRGQDFFGGAGVAGVLTCAERRSRRPVISRRQVFPQGAVSS